MTSSYNRSQIYSYFDLTTEQQEQALDTANDIEHAQDRNYVIFEHPRNPQVLPLDMFIAIREGKPTVFHGIYAQDYFSAYFVKFNKSNDEALIAYRYN